MTKNIVLCSDGTGNQDVKNRGTNVFKLYEAVDLQGHKEEPDELREQIAFYDDGVGTANAFAKVVGGAFGWGFSRNVKKMYRELVNVYKPGDRIFLFGFSRGAYTVRALAGFIQYCGIMDADYFSTQDREELTDKIVESWDEFSKVAFRSASDETRRGKVPTPEEAAAERKASIARREKNHAVEPEKEIDIDFIGVWDTVGAIATPFDELRWLMSYLIRPIWFADNTLGPEVKRACHALALDEERRTFHPELWNEQNGADTRIKQVWFAGVHSNVGGGYPKQGMSLVSLDWMMNEAKQAGLRFIEKDLEFVRLHQDVHDKLYDSRSGLAVYYRWLPRDLSQLCAEHKVAKPKIHISVFERIANATAGMNGKDSYSPGNLPFNLEVDTSSSINSWPGATVSHRIPPLVSVNSDTSHPSLLAKMKGTVLFGQASYYFFLFVTLATLLAFAVMGVKAWCGRWDCADLICLMSATLFFVVGSIIAHSWAYKVDCKLCEEFTEFWHRRRRNLRDMIFPNVGGTPT